MFTKSRKPARQLMQDDRFKMGGIMYRISRIDIDRLEGKVYIEAYSIDDPTSTIEVRCSTSTRFEIYNLE